MFCSVFQDRYGRSKHVHLITQKQFWVILLKQLQQMIHGFNKRFHNFFKLPLLLGTQEVLSLQRSQWGVFPNIISLRSSHRDILIVCIGFKILSDVTLIGKFGFLILYFHGEENFTSKVLLSSEYLVLIFPNIFLTGCQTLSTVVSYKKRSSSKIRKIHSKTPVPVSLF